MLCSYYFEQMLPKAVIGAGGVVRNILLSAINTLTHIRRRRALRVARSFNE